MAKTITTGFINATINGIKVNSSVKTSSSNYTNVSSRSVSFIVMHYTGNAKDTAKANANYFHSGGRKASAHFFVDDSNIYQTVELRDRAWHCGASSGYSYHHASCRNTNSFGIEMCTSGNYKVSDKTKRNSAYLCAYLCKMLGITADKVDTYVLRHYDVTHKSCPAQMAGASNTEWTAFKSLVKKILNGSSTTAKQDNTSSSSSDVDWTKPQSYDSNFKGGKKYKVCANLNLRKGAGTDQTIVKTLVNGSYVFFYGYYTVREDTKWFYVAHGDYTGFVAARYLKLV